MYTGGTGAGRINLVCLSNRDYNISFQRKEKMSSSPSDYTTCWTVLMRDTRHLISWFCWVYMSRTARIPGTIKDPLTLAVDIWCDVPYKFFKQSNML